MADVTKTKDTNRPKPDSSCPEAHEVGNDSLAAYRTPATDKPANTQTKPEAKPEPATSSKSAKADMAQLDLSAPILCGQATGSFQSEIGGRKTAPAEAPAASPAEAPAASPESGVLPSMTDAQFQDALKAVKQAVDYSADGHESFGEFLFGRKFDADSLSNILRYMNQTDRSKLAHAVQDSKTGSNPGNDKSENWLEKAINGANISATEKQGLLYLLNRKDNDQASQTADDISSVLEKLPVSDSANKNLQEWELRSLLARSSAAELKEIAQSYSAMNKDAQGKPRDLWQDIYNDSNISQATKDAIKDVYSKGADHHSDADSLKLADIGLQSKNLKLFEEAMAGASAEARKEFMGSDGAKKIAAAFPPPDSSAYDDEGYLSRREDSWNYQEALDYANYGKVSMATQIAENNGNRFTEDTQGILLALQTPMSSQEIADYTVGKNFVDGGGNKDPKQEQLYQAGRLLSEGTAALKLDQQKANELLTGVDRQKAEDLFRSVEYYKRLHKATQDSGMAPELNDRIQNGESTIISTIASDQRNAWQLHYNPDKIESDITQMSEKQFQDCLQHPEERRAQLSDLLKSYKLDKDQVDQIMKTWDNKVNVMSNQINAVNDILHVDPARYREDAAFRQEFDKKIDQTIVDPTVYSYAQKMLEQIKAGEAPGTGIKTSDIGNALVANAYDDMQRAGNPSLADSLASGKMNSKDLLEAVQHMTPADQKRYASDAAYRANINNAVNHLFEPGSFQQPTGELVDHSPSPVEQTEPDHDARLVVNDLLHNVQQGKSPEPDLCDQLLIARFDAADTPSKQAAASFKTFEDALNKDPQLRQQLQKEIDLAQAWKLHPEQHAQLQKDNPNWQEMLKAADRFETTAYHAFAPDTQGMSAVIDYNTAAHEFIKNGYLSPARALQIEGDSFASDPDRLAAEFLTQRKQWVDADGKLTPQAQKALFDAFKQNGTKYDEQQVLMKIIQQGKVTDADRIRAAVVGGNAADVVAALKQSGNLEDARKEYFAYGADMDSTVLNRLSGENLKDAQSLLEKSLPFSQQYDLAEKHAIDSLGDGGTRFVAWAFNDNAWRQISAGLTEGNATMEAMQRAYKNLSPEQQKEQQQQLLEMADKFKENLDELMKHNAGNKEKYADEAFEAAITAVSIPTIIMGGGPTVAVMLRLTMAGALMKLATNKAIMGNDYDNSAKQVITDLLTGGFTGFASTLSAPMVAQMMRIGTTLGEGATEAAAKSLLLAKTSTFVPFTQEGKQALAPLEKFLVGDGDQAVLKQTMMPQLKTMMSKMLGSGEKELNQKDITALAEQLIKKDPQMSSAEREAAVKALATDLKTSLQPFWNQQIQNKAVNFARVYMLAASAGGLSGGGGELLRESLDGNVDLSKVTEQALRGYVTALLTAAVVGGGLSSFKAIKGKLTAAEEENPDEAEAALAAQRANAEKAAAAPEKPAPAAVAEKPAPAAAAEKPAPAAAAAEKPAPAAAEKPAPAAAAEKPAPVAAKENPAPAEQAEKPAPLQEKPASLEAVTDQAGVKHLEQQPGATENYWSSLVARHDVELPETRGAYKFSSAGERTLQKPIAVTPADNPDGVYVSTAKSPITLSEDLELANNAKWPAGKPLPPGVTISKVFDKESKQWDWVLNGPGRDKPIPVKLSTGQNDPRAAMTSTGAGSSGSASGGPVKTGLISMRQTIDSQGNLAIDVGVFKDEKSISFPQEQFEAMPLPAGDQITLSSGVGARVGRNIAANQDNPDWLLRQAVTGPDGKTTYRFSIIKEKNLMALTDGADPQSQAQRLKYIDTLIADNEQAAAKAAKVATDAGDQVQQALKVEAPFKTYVAINLRPGSPIQDGSSTVWGNEYAYQVGGRNIAPADQLKPDIRLALPGDVAIKEPGDESSFYVPEGWYIQDNYAQFRQGEYVKNAPFLAAQIPKDPATGFDLSNKPHGHGDPGDWVLVPIKGGKPQPDQAYIVPNGKFEKTSMLAGDFQKAQSQHLQLEEMHAKLLLDEMREKNVDTGVHHATHPVVANTVNALSSGNSNNNSSSPNEK